MTNNAAANCHFGIWYAMPNVPMSFSYTIHINDPWLQSLRTQPLLLHANNVVHGCSTGLMIDLGVNNATGVSESSSYKPTVGNVVVGATFSNVIAYKNHDTGIWARGSKLILENPVLIDNEAGTFTPNGPNLVVNGLYIADSGNVDPWLSEADWRDRYWYKVGGMTA